MFENLIRGFEIGEALSFLAIFAIAGSIVFCFCVFEGMRSIGCLIHLAINMIVYAIFCGEFFGNSFVTALILTYTLCNVICFIIKFLIRVYKAYERKKETGYWLHEKDLLDAYEYSRVMYYQKKHNCLVLNHADRINVVNEYYSDEEKAMMIPYIREYYANHAMFKKK